VFVSLLSHHTVVWGIFSLLCVCLFFVRLRISQRRKKIGREILHACSTTTRTGLLPFGKLWLAGSHGGGITSGMCSATNWMQVAAGMYTPTNTFTLGPGAAAATFDGDSELGALARSGFRSWGRRRCLRPCGAICVLQAC